MKQNLHPSVYAGSIHIFPPMRSIISWQIDNPSPDPCAVSFSFSKRLKMFACFSGGIPQPVSVTEKSAYSSDCNSTSRVMLPSTVNLVALMSRLMSNCCKRESSVYSCNEVSGVLKRSAARVCFTLLTVSITLLQMAMQRCHTAKFRLVTQTD